MDSLIVRKFVCPPPFLSSNFNFNSKTNAFFLHLSNNKLRPSVVASSNKAKNDAEPLLLQQVQEDSELLPEFADAEEEELFEALNLELESEQNAELMRHYEVVYLIHEDHEDKVESVNAKVQEFLKEKKGKIWRFSDWGLRRLAYKIQKASRAHYILMNFELGAKWINDFKSMLDKDERVIRHLVMKRDKAETEDCPPPPEFHTLRAGAGDENEEDMDDYDEDDWEDEDEDDIDDADTDGIILVDIDDGVGDRNSQRTDTREMGKRKVKV